MAASSEPEPSPTAVDVDAIASRSFSSSFRGWDPDEVRVHLVAVAETVRALRQHESELERRLAEAEAAVRRADLTQLDPDEVDRLLGEETAKVLRAARESAAEIISKATSQAELLTSQAADDAAERRSKAESDAERARAEATETAEAIRSAGEAHVAEERAAGESELADLRAELETEMAEARQQARDESSELVADAEDRATSIRRETDEAAEEVRAEAEQEASTLRAEADSYARRITSEAERMRDMVLSDLARRRKAARQHLEQLHAGRERLLAAYEVIRVTTDQATDELGAVLIEAKRAADDAAREVGAEPVPSVDEMLAELEQTDLPEPIETPVVEESDASTAGDGSDDEQEYAKHEDRESDQDLAGDGEWTPGDPTSGVDRAPQPTTARVNEAEPAETAAVPPEQTTPPGRRRHGRRTRRRGHDPSDGESLPEGPLDPVGEAAEFEEVRVVTADSSGSESPEATSVVTDEPAPPPPTSSSESVVDGGMDPQASGIFERLRALQHDDIPAEEPEGQDESEPAVADRSTAAAGGSAVATEPIADGDADAVPARQAPDSPTADGGASSAGATSEDERLAGLFERRDDAVEEVARRLSKHLKRHLSDQQSELLDELRRARKVAAPEEYLGDADEFCATLRTVAVEDLSSAVTAGSMLAGEICDEANTGGGVDLDPVVAELIEAVAVPLRTRLVRALGEADEDGGEDDPGALDDRDLADRIRACYREWRGARLTAAVSDACGQAFGEGLRAALPDGVGLRWYCSPGAEPCSDCNDNELAGTVATGENFPTGQAVAPAHPGCRCLALPPLEERSTV